MTVVSDQLSVVGEITGTILMRRKIFISLSAIVSPPMVRTTNKRGAPFVDKILKGAKPSDISVEQPTSLNSLTIRKPPSRSA